MSHSCCGVVEKRLSKALGANVGSKVAVVCVAECDNTLRYQSHRDDIGKTFPSEDQRSIEAV